MAAKKISMSMPTDLWSRARERAAKLGYASFSEYTQFLLEEDCQLEPEHIIRITRGGPGVGRELSRGLDDQVPHDENNGLSDS